MQVCSSIPVRKHWTLFWLHTKQFSWIELPTHPIVLLLRHLVHTHCLDWFHVAIRRVQWKETSKDWSEYSQTDLFGQRASDNLYMSRRDHLAEHTQSACLLCVHARLFICSANACGLSCTILARTNKNEMKIVCRLTWMGSSAALNVQNVNPPEWCSSGIGPFQLIVAPWFDE